MIHNRRPILTNRLVSLDIESTGTDPLTDRIVELALIVCTPEDIAADVIYRFNPGIPIPVSATAVHGITDADVADCKAFADHAAQVAALLEGADVCGHGVRRFDLVMLELELHRAGIPCPKWGAVVDTLEIETAVAPRDLGALVLRYTGTKHTGAHGARADARAVLDVLNHQLKTHNLSDDLKALDALVQPEDCRTWVEPTGRLRRRADGAVVLGFGEHKDKTLDECPRGFLEWMTSPGQNFHPRCLSVVRDALATHPEQPVDPECKMVRRRDGQVEIRFGQHRGKTLSELARADAGFLRWILTKDFHPEIKAAVRSSLT